MPVTIGKASRMARDFVRISSGVNESGRRVRRATLAFARSERRQSALNEEGGRLGNAC